MKSFLLFLVTASLIFLPGICVAGEGWVSADRLNRRSCPSSSCGVVGTLMFREKVTIHETKGKWARISKYYNAACSNGTSPYVDSGNARCVPDNGIEQGEMAEWVAAKYLSETRPEEPGKNAAGDYRLVKASDDYRIHKDAFAKAARELIESGKCRAADFVEMGGWMKSTNQRSKPVYFTYCGGLSSQNKIYLNAATGKTYK